MENTNKHLASLKNDNLGTPNAKQDVLNWEVKTEGGAYVGFVADLLYDTNAMTVRYLIIDLTENGMNLNGKSVMIPVGLATLHPSNNEIILPNIHADQFNLLPNYVTEEISNSTEQLIRNIIGSPAALRLEETVAEYDQQQFYAHHHFNESNFYSRKPATTGEMPEQRVEQRETVTKLITNSLNDNLHAADDETGTNSHHNEGRKIEAKSNNSDSSPFVS